jgi:hypothetical protein
MLRAMSSRRFERHLWHKPKTNRSIVMSIEDIENHVKYVRSLEQENEALKKDARNYELWLKVCLHFLGGTVNIAKRPVQAKDIDKGVYFGSVECGFMQE